MEEEGGELTPEKEEEVLTKVDAVTILEMLVEEVKTQVRASKVVKELTNQRFNAIIIKAMDIFHMNAERDIIIKTSKFNIIHTTQVTKLALCLCHTL
jgi:hypothetical protein